MLRVSIDCVNKLVYILIERKDFFLRLSVRFCVVHF